MKKYIFVILFLGSIYMPIQGQELDTVPELYFEIEKPNQWIEPTYVFGKEEYFFSRKKEISVKMTNLLSLFVPFNFSLPNPRLIALQTKFYGRKTAFRFAAGGDLNENDDNSFLMFKLGFERRKLVWNLFTYTSGWEGILTITGSNQESFPGIAVGNFHGLEYNFSPNISISMETELLFGLGLFESIIFKILPPTSLFVNYRF